MERKQIQILLIDDEPLSLDASREKLARFVPKENIHTASNAVQVLQVIRSIPVHLAFVDVEMPETDGFALVDYIRQVQPGTRIVFLTGHTELGAKSYDYEPLDFLSKPPEDARLEKTFERFERSMGRRESQQEQLALEGPGGFVLITPSEIRYIAREGRKTVLHMTGMTREVRVSLDELELMLGDFGFFRCHQSFLVPLRQVRSVAQADFGRTFTAHLVCGEKLPVSRSKYPVLRERLASGGVPFL